MRMRCCSFVLFVTIASVSASTLLIAEDGSRGEDPPPLGDLIRVDTVTRSRSVIAKGLQDPVWTAAEGGFAYVGLFHAGTVVQVDLSDGAVKTVATGLSCPEGIGLDRRGFLYVVENPIGNECAQPVRKPAAQLTRINMTSGEQLRVASLKEPHGMDIHGTTAYICENGEFQVTRVDLESGSKERVTGMEDNSGCAYSEGYVYAIEEGLTGSLVKISTGGGAKTTLIDGLQGPMGVAVDANEGFVYAGERRANRVVRVPIDGGAPEVFVESLRSNIGLTIIPSAGPSEDLRFLFA